MTIATDTSIVSDAGRLLFMLTLMIQQHHQWTGRGEMLAGMNEL